ncbi:hypothetical protein A9995_07010 [Erythrobacter sp. QSSC1-22B]|uniref:TolC family protein n=1 Tax=Erythrobacter sp. QSSC1-22B TaxID=1860125 RepID=UPI000804BDBF|nr:TolC family protein [Erythrobacter sp. QSSC1-22B]OBX19493.1 hypothetical protein A9995_07010 [Erythrobacter sp. QSSC1-22B]
MPKFRVHRAPFTSSVALCACVFFVSMPVTAQDTPLSEDVAVEGALAREGLAAREDAEIAASLAEIDRIGPRENPTVQLSRESMGGDSEWELGIVQPIDLNGRRGTLREAARAEARAVDADIERRRQLLVGEVRSAYVRCAASRASLDIQQRYVTELEEAGRVSTARAQAGDTAVYDVRRVRVEQRSADARLAMARGEVAGDCAALSSLTGIDDPQLSIEAITSVVSGGGEADRADLVAQERRLTAATQLVEAARQAQLPQIGVGAGVKRVDDGLGVSYGPVVSLGVSLPIWNGGGAEVRRSEALRNARESELLIARRRAEAERAAAAARASAAREAAVMAVQARADAGRLGTIADTAYQSGEIGVVELLDAYQAARDADLSIVALALDAALAAVAYDLANGRTYQ